MSEEIEYLTKADVADFNAMRAEWRQRMAMLQLASLTPTQTPDVYIVYTPGGGIPAASSEPTTGTDSSIIDVNNATCDCYRIDDSVPSDLDVFKIGRQLPIWNLSTTAVTGNTIGLGVKDKTGKWVFVPVGSGMGGVGSPQTADLTSDVNLTSSYASIKTLTFSTPGLYLVAAQVSAIVSFTPFGFVNTNLVTGRFVDLTGGSNTLYSSNTHQVGPLYTNTYFQTSGSAFPTVLYNVVAAPANLDYQAACSTTPTGGDSAKIVALAGGHNIGTTFNICKLS